MAILGDLIFRMPAVRLAQAQSAHCPEDTRMYLFAWKTPVRGGRLGAPHAVKVPFVFGNLDAKGVNLYPANGEDRRALSNFVQDDWIAFARSGDPNHLGLPVWPASRTDARATLDFDEITTVEHNPSAAERSIWADVPFDGLNPPIEHCVPSTWEMLSSFHKRFPVGIRSPRMSLASGPHGHRNLAYRSSPRKTD
jgi:carboxylesterase type B